MGVVVNLAQPRDVPLVERRARGELPLAWSNRAETMSRTMLLAADLTAITVMAALALLLHHFMPGRNPAHWPMWYLIMVWVLLRSASGLYSPCSKYPPIELQLSFETSAAVLCMHFGLLVAVQETSLASFAGLLVWPLALPLTYSLRTIARGRLIRRGLYGVPLVVIGNSDGARRAIREYLARPEMGFVPVAVFTSELTQPGERHHILGVPLVGRMEQAADYRFPYKVRHALLAIGSGWAEEKNHQLSKSLAKRFNNVQIFTNLITQAQLLTQARPLGPYLTIETEHVRFSRSQRILKRALDVSIALPVLIVAIPVMFVVGIAIKLSDPGPIFFSQIREGLGGKPIRIYKLRSMIVGAEAKLASYLAQNPEAMFEYEQTLKLRKDPRILPGIGAFIRRSSIDELPQLWNVLRGDISLVGPRVMPSREIDLYSQDGRELRRDMLPGLTGFWQVEHRNDSDFQVRELADSFYVANWSVWLDLWIILRTVRVLANASGAY